MIHNSKEQDVAHQGGFDIFQWFPDSLAPWQEQMLGLGVLILLCTVLLLILRALRKLVLVPLIRKSRNTWDDVFVDKKFIRWVSYLPPALLAFLLVDHVPGMRGADVWQPGLPDIVRNIAIALMTLGGMFATGALLDGGNVIYQRRPGATNRPIRGYVTLAKILLYALGTVAAVAFLLDKDPTALLLSMGGLTAVLMLVFKDTILSLVASVQLASQGMVRVGDWIEVPDAGADGDVIDIGLHTIKVQNWDRTITSVPTTHLVSKSFKNWRNMAEGPGRRIKRNLLLDTNSIRFLAAADIERLGRAGLLHEYLAEKKTALAESNRERDQAVPLDHRRLTNSGTFRAYVERYLRNHPAINQDLTLMVRQLQPSGQGLPLELYCFTRTTVWKEYEAIQADLLDHLIAAAHEFDLRLFQTPAGSDIAAAVARMSGTT